MMSLHQKIEYNLDGIKRQYNPDWDHMPNHPTVTSTDISLLMAIEDLQAIVLQLENKYATMNEDINKGGDDMK